MTGQPTVTERRPDEAPSAPARPPTPRSVRALRFVPAAITVAMVLVISYLVLLPLAVLIYSSLKASATQLPFEVPGLSLDNFWAVFSSSQLLKITVNTGVYVLGSLIVSLVLALVFAYLFERTNIPGRRALTSLALTPMAVPATVMAIAWALVANPSNGPLTVLIEKITGWGINIYSLPGMIVVMGIFGVPSTYLMIAPALARLNPELEEVAAVAGAPLRRRLRLILFPLVAPAVSAAAMFQVIVALEGFAIPAILGLPNQIFVYSSLIQYSLQPPSGIANYGRASTYGVLILVLSLVMLLIYRRQIRNANKFKVVTGKGYKPKVVSLGRWRHLVGIVTWGVMVVMMVLPLLALVWTSLSPYAQPISWKGSHSLSFDAFTRIFTSPNLWQFALNTAEISLFTAFATTALSIWISVAAARRQFRGSGFLFELTFLVYGIPSVVLGAAILFLYLFIPIPIYGTIWIIVVALTTRYLPRGSRFVQTALLQIDDGLLESGRSTGARPFTVTRKILLPLLRPALTRCWLWVFAHALGELPISLLLTSANNKTLVVMLWDSFTSSVDYPDASALAIVILVVSSIAVWAVSRRSAADQVG